MSETEITKTEIVKLDAPIMVGGKEISEISVRASTVGDEEDAMQMAIREKRGDNPVTVELFVISKVTRLPYDAIRSLPGPVYQKLRRALNTANGLPAVKSENPTNGTEARD